MNQRDKLKNYFNSIKRKLDTLLEGTPHHDSLKSQLHIADENFRVIRNNVNRLVRTAKTKCFNLEINEKLKFAKQYHNALKHHNVVENKFLGGNCSIDPNTLNEAFTSNNNSKVNDD